MNEIRVKRMLLAGLAMFVMWIVVELLVEQVIGRVIFGNLIQEGWLQTTNIGDWNAQGHIVNIAFGLLNCTLLIWLYASLRPMYGVGTKTALITSAFGFVFVVSLLMNLVNLGILPRHLGLVEAVYLAIEFPIAMLVGASAYEGAQEQAE